MLFDIHKLLCFRNLHNIIYELKNRHSCLILCVKILLIKWNIQTIQRTMSNKISDQNGHKGSRMRA